MTEEAGKFLAEFESDLSAPESYLQPSSRLQARCLHGVKTVFDFYKRCSQDALSTGLLTVPTGPLSELYTDGFDNEQIWEEIELMNEPALKRLKKLVKKVSSQLSTSNRLADAPSSGPVRGEESKAEPLDEEDGGYRDSDLDKESIQFLDDGSAEVKTRGKNERTGHVKSIVDDKFFKLSEMEKFVEMVENEETKNKIPDDDDLSDSGSEGLDMFADTPQDGDYGDDTSTNPRYEDFFDAPNDDNVHISKKVKFGGSEENTYSLSDYPENGNDNATDASGVSDDDNDAIEDDKEGADCDSNEEVNDDSGMQIEDNETALDKASDFGTATVREEEDVKKELSTHEKKLTKLSKKIAELEKMNLATKSWQMGGETTGKARPHNSLLEEDIVFDHMTRPAPIITEETTQTLEDIIKQRIIDEAWDDVERKIKPAEKPYNYSKSRPLEQEKSKLGLAEVYEQEYLKQTQATEEIKEDERHTEIRRLLKKLFYKLDALSNFHFTPKPPKPDVKIIANVPAIQMEEVAPLIMSDAMRLAPEELKEKSLRPEIGDSEKTVTNRKQERRLKKRHKRLQLAEKKQREKVLAKLRPGLGNKFTRKSLEKKLKDKEQDELVDKSLKSSSRFFAKLQEEVKEQVKSTRREKGTVKSRTSSGQQFKL